jgi:exopolyphosphatase/pppGpp-phosphohydrolase
MNPTSLFDASLGQEYAFVRSRVSTPARVTLLHIGEQSTAILSGLDDRTDAGLILAMGAKRTAQMFFRHDPPTPLELEYAIADVEDHVMKARSLPRQDAALVSMNPTLRELAQTVGADAAGGRVLSLDVVEALFQRLASASLGHPSATKGMPAGSEAAAVLLILREFMHHLGYASVIVLASQ